MSTRRRFLAATVAGLAGSAGCTALSGSDGPADLRSHPATADLDSQPTLGPDPGDAEAVAVAFLSTSCSLCAGFENGALPEMRRKLVEEGRLSFVYRESTESLTGQVLEAVHARDEDAFWALHDHLYANFLEMQDKGSFTVAMSYLREESSFDADAVLEAATTDVHENAVRTDVAAAYEADVDGEIGIVCFREGEYRTTVTTPHSYDVFATALGFETDG